MKPIPTDANRKNITPNIKTKLFETTHNIFSWVYNNGYTKSGKHWSENVQVAIVHGNYNTSSPLPESIAFPNEEQAMNFENSTKTTFHRYMILSMKTDQHYPMRFVPFLEGVENPRTHKLGYESDWTNEDFCKLYEIIGYLTDTTAEPESEWNTVLKTMNPYLDK